MGDNDCESIHHAAFEEFVRSKHGRELWHLHYNAGVSIVDDVTEMTRAQKVVVAKLDDYWSEKLQDEHGGGSLPSSRGMASNVPTSF